MNTRLIASDSTPLLRLLNPLVMAVQFAPPSVLFKIDVKGYAPVEIEKLVEPA